MIRTISTFKVLFYVTVILGTLLNVAQVLKLRSNAGRIKQDNVQVSSLGHTEANKADFHIEQFSVFSQFSGEKIINSTHLSIISQSSEEESIQVDLVKPDDIIYSSGWDSAPIVLDEYKLVFFTIPKAGCTIWKQLFRRMMGFKNWQKQSQANDVKELPHNPKFNGLTYLHHYSLEEASQIMTSREWTRAIFVRDPKERFLSAFLDKALSNGGVHVQKKCCPNGECKKDAQTFPGFINLVFKGGCKNPHWNPQNNRMENKYWKHVNFVGKFENASEDAKRLLQKVGAWEKYGATGWGDKKDKAIFETSANAVSHATNSKWRMWEYYTPELETLVEHYYSADYANPVLNISITKLY